ncbi:hypothetical protein GDO78_016199 [Eleutherodactylus coqui]|uniref:Uncharacterized protein n=1 Tax=Eleutherodactylus coqui TaxID=57060 RepID=A0A8J6BRN6_ELECQ|nr:hypothetical protein GDO78_016199 [Eleutherodactylus coqui]
MLALKLLAGEDEASTSKVSSDIRNMIAMKMKIQPSSKIHIMKSHRKSSASAPPPSVCVAPPHLLFVV